MPPYSIRCRVMLHEGNYLVLHREQKLHREPPADCHCLQILIEQAPIYQSVLELERGSDKWRHSDIQSDNASTEREPNQRQTEWGPDATPSIIANSTRSLSVDISESTVPNLRQLEGGPSVFGLLFFVEMILKCRGFRDGFWA